MNVVTLNCCDDLRFFTWNACLNQACILACCRPIGEIVKFAALPATPYCEATAKIHTDLENFHARKRCQQAGNFPPSKNVCFLRLSHAPGGKDSTPFIESQLILWSKWQKHSLAWSFWGHFSKRTRRGASSQDPACSLATSLVAMIYDAIVVRGDRWIEQKPTKQINRKKQKTGKTFVSVENQKFFTSAGRVLKPNIFSPLCVAWFTKRNVLNVNW